MAQNGQQPTEATSYVNHPAAPFQQETSVSSQAQQDQISAPSPTVNTNNVGAVVQPGVTLPQGNAMSALAPFLMQPLLAQNLLQQQGNTSAATQNFQQQHQHQQQVNPINPPQVPAHVNFPNNNTVQGTQGVASIQWNLQTNNNCTSQESSGGSQWNTLASFMPGAFGQLGQFASSAAAPMGQADTTNHAENASQPLQAEQAPLGTTTAQLPPPVTAVPSSMGDQAPPQPLSFQSAYPLQGLLPPNGTGMGTPSAANPGFILTPSAPLFYGGMMLAPNQAPLMMPNFITQMAAPGNSAVTGTGNMALPPAPSGESQGGANNNIVPAVMPSSSFALSAPQPATSSPQQDNDVLANCERTRLPMPIYMDFDEETLTEYQCLLRKQIELFEAGPEDIKASAQGRNNPILLGQVGIRCRHCASFPLKCRPRGAIYYSRTIDGLYQVAQNMSKLHFCRTCKMIPKDVQLRLSHLQRVNRRAAGGKEYWAEGLRVLGVYEDGNVMRFREPGTWSNDKGGENGGATDADGTPTQNADGTPTTTPTTGTAGIAAATTEEGKDLGAHPPTSGGEPQDGNGFGDTGPGSDAPLADSTAVSPTPVAS